MILKKISLALAITLSSNLFATSTVESKLNDEFIAALKMRDNGDLFAAIEALKKILVTSPRLNRARLELAVSYYRAALFDEAKTHAEKVLNAPDTPAEVKETVTLFLEELNAIKEAEIQNRHTFSSYVSMGLGHDNNVNAGPTSDLFSINGSEFSLIPGSTSQHSMYGQFNIHTDHTYRLPGSTSIGNELVTAFWKSSAEFYRRDYEESALNSLFSVDVLSASTGPALISRKDWRADILFNIDYIRLGDEPLATYTSLNPSFTKVSGSNDITIHSKIGYRRFMPNSSTNREGMRYGLGLDWGHQFNKKWLGLTGINFYEQDGRVSYEEYDVTEVYGSLYWQGWQGGAIYGRSAYKKTSYNGKEPLFDTNRNEYETNVVLGASHEFQNSDGWSINARINYTDNSARIPIYNYDRADAIVEIIKRF
ncbi:MAG: hypothetical protein OQL19_12210 [Gammaproteobacteria bacterium]|nr:hypothetical protein [Gammaproteobacteria bacterium]